MIYVLIGIGIIVWIYFLIANYYQNNLSFLLTFKKNKDLIKTLNKAKYANLAYDLEIDLSVNKIENIPDKFKNLPIEIFKQPDEIIQQLNKKNPIKNQVMKDVIFR